MKAGGKEKILQFDNVPDWQKMPSRELLLASQQKVGRGEGEGGGPAVSWLRGPCKVKRRNSFHFLLIQQKNNYYCDIED